MYHSQLFHTGDLRNQVEQHARVDSRNGSLPVTTLKIHTHILARRINIFTTPGVNIISTRFQY